MPKNPLFFFVLILLLMLEACSSPDFILLETKKLTDYPSGSGMEFFKGKIFLVGDDARYCWVGDTSLKQTDSIRLYEGTERRIAKDLKEDLEAIALVYDGKTPKLFLAGSGSLPPFRNRGWLIDPATGEKEPLLLDSFYNRLQQQLPQINIEGATAITGALVLANRGNKSQPKNQLIFTTPDFWKRQDSAQIDVVKIGTNKDTALFEGISGLAYSFRSDRLFITVTTEDTYSSHGDGAIGRSFLWIVNDISSRKRITAINPSRVIDLQKTDAAFAGQKIESACILSEDATSVELLLVADNDNGESTLFRVRLKN
ncbi:MAG: hypothetical protein JWQ27_517 [Ferruginibacter sp.]|nr:hypothetical protein [Ferruginibacter sp.]